MEEHKKLGRKQVSKVTLHFVSGHLTRKQTVERVFMTKSRCENIHVRELFAISMVSVLQF